MSEFVSTIAKRRLQDAINRLKSSVEAPRAGNWKRLSDAELWGRVLVQISVVGGAESGGRLRNELDPVLADWYEALRAKKQGERIKSIHKMLRNSGVRYVTASIDNCKKSKAASYNFELLQAYGGPKKYFEDLAKVPEEFWRVGIVSDEMQYIRSKGARDLLIGLGMVENAIALDSRLQKVLSRVGIELPDDLAMNRSKYKLLESELLQKICKPCGVTGAHFDRILFNNGDDVV